MRQVGVEYFIVPAAQGDEQLAAGPRDRRRRRRDHPGRDARRGPRRARTHRRRPARLPSRLIATNRRLVTFTLAAMAISFSRPDPSSPAAVADAAFGTARRGFDQQEVRDFLRMVAAELARLQERERFLERELRAAQTIGVADGGPIIDDDTATRLLGEETARILQAAREGAAAIRAKAEEGAGAAAARGGRRGPARARGGRARGQPHAAPMPLPTPRPSWRWPSSRAARWSRRRAPTASGCSPSCRAGATSPASRSSSSSTAATGCCRRSSGPASSPSTSSPS